MRPEGKREGEGRGGGREGEGEREGEGRGGGREKEEREREIFMKAMISQLVFTVFSPRR